MKWLSLLALAPLALAFQTPRTPILDRHVQALRSAGTIHLTLRVVEVGAAPVQFQLTVAAPNRVVLETPEGRTVADGKSVTRWDRAKNRYTVDESPNAARTLLNGTATWAWSPLLNPDFSQGVISESRGATRRIGSKATQEVVVQRRNQPSVTLFMDAETGMAIGGTFRTPAGKDVVLQVVEVKIGPEAASAETFAWKAPAGAVKEEASAVPALKFADISPLIERNCRCHLDGGSAGGVTLGTLSEVRRQVTPGQPGASRLVQAVQSGRMPPMRPLPKPDMDRLAKWVEDGAQP